MRMQGWYYPGTAKPCSRSFMRESTKPSRAELGNLLRTSREQLNPFALGMYSSRRRRTRGLRREEVAELAGIGVDRYIPLEQGRDVNPSSTTIDALARALRLQPAEHAHLRALTRGTEQQPFTRETVPQTLRHIVETLEQPAYVTGRRWDVLAWNAAAADLFTDFGAVCKATATSCSTCLPTRVPADYSAQAGRVKLNAWSRSFAATMTFGQPTERFSTWKDASLRNAPSFPPGGRSMTSENQ